MKKILLLTVMLAMFSVAGCSCKVKSSTEAERLTVALNEYIDSCRAEIGVAVITDSGDTVCVGADGRFPLNSVMKLYQAMAVIDTIQRQGVSLDSVIEIRTAELHPTTYSPMRDAHPDGDFAISIAGLLGYSLKESDNNACDVLFDRFCGVGETQAYVRSLGIGDFSIEVNEREMTDDHSAASCNWATPLSAARLINMLFKSDLYVPVYQDFLTETLIGCLTGEKRLSRPFRPTNAVIGHKTGTGFSSAEGFPMGINDVGFVRLPNGRSYAIAVFIRSSLEDMESTEMMIGDISEIVARLLSDCLVAS